MTKPWTHHATPTAEGERKLVTRLTDESGLPRETAQLFATARISMADLEAVLRAAAVRFVNDMPDYQYAYFQKHWPNAFTGTFTSKERVAATFADVLLATVRKNLKNSPNLSWGQLISRPKLLYSDPQQPAPFERFDALTTAISDTITWFDFDGARGTPDEQLALTTVLAKKGALIHEKIQELGKVPATPEAQEVGGYPADSNDPRFALRILARQVTECKQGSQDDRTKEKLTKLYKRIEQLTGIFADETAFALRPLNQRRALQQELRNLPNAMQAILNPPPVVRKNLWQKMGLQKNVSPPPRRPEFADEPDMFYEEMDTDKPLPRIEAAPPEHRQPHVVFAQTAQLARELSRFNKASNVVAYEEGARDRHHYHIATFAADRILSGQQVEEAFIGQSKKKQQHDCTMRGAYCLAGVVKPFVDMKCARGKATEDDRDLATILGNVISDTRHYAPGKATASRQVA